MDLVGLIVWLVIGGWLFSSGDINDGVVTPTTFIVSLVGAILLLAVVNLVRRGAMR